MQDERDEKLSCKTFFQQEERKPNQVEREGLDHVINFAVFFSERDPEAKKTEENINKKIKKIIIIKLQKTRENKERQTDTLESQVASGLTYLF